MTINMVEMVKAYIRGAISDIDPKENIDSRWINGYRSGLIELHRYILETEATINAKNDPQK